MLHPRLPLVLLALTGLFIAGCAAGPDRDARNGGAATDLIIQPEPAYDVGYHIGWARDLAVGGDRALSSVTLLEDLIVTIERPSNMITATQVRDGKVRWRTIVGQPTDQFFAPVRFGDELLVPSERQLFSLRVEDGGIANIANLEDVVLSSPVVVDERAIFGTATGEILAHHITTGFTDWSYGLRERILASPAEVGFNVFGADTSGEYALLDARLGSLLWRRYFFGGVVAQAAVDRLNIYVPSLDRSLYALDRVTGQDRWIYRAPTPLRHSPVSLELSVYQPVAEVGLVSLNSRTGEVQWTLPEPARALTLQNEQTLLAYGPYKLITLDTASGNVLNEAPTDRLATAISGPDGSVIIVGMNGQMVRLNPR